MRPVFPCMLKGVFFYVFHKVRVDNRINPDCCKDITPGQFKAFRYAERVREVEPGARFEITFQLKNMSAKENEKFSLLPMFFVIGCKGFRSKYWLVNEQTNTCKGIYQWDSLEDAVEYSKSFAVKFMEKRSVEGSVHYKIDQIL